MLMSIFMFLVSFGIATVGLTVLMFLTTAKSPAWKKYGAAVAFVLVIVGQWLWYSKIYNSAGRETARAALADAEFAESECISTSGAFVVSQGFVKQSLKAPSTAKFSSSAVSSTVVGKCQFVVAAYVDSQNGFGANIRSNYVAKLEYLPASKQWRLLSLTM